MAVSRLDSVILSFESELREGRGGGYQGKKIVSGADEHGASVGSKFFLFRDKGKRAAAHDILVIRWGSWRVKAALVAHPATLGPIERQQIPKFN
jgi:hypothetical protein